MGLLGPTHWICNGFGGWLGNEVDMYFNTGAMSSLKAYEKKLVAMHEIGHAYGIAHNSLGCSYPGPSLMRQGTTKFGCSGVAPWNYDLDNVWQRYF